MARWAQPHPALWPAMLVTAPMVVLTWCLLPTHEIACVVVALSMPVLVRLAAGVNNFTSQSGSVNRFTSQVSTTLVARCPGK